MRILFLPQSFPGPFRYIAARLALLPESRVLFITDSFRRDVHIPRVRRILVSLPHTAPVPDRAEYEILRDLRRGNCMGSALMRLKSTGFIPDIIIAHAGQGGSLYIKDVFPHAFYVAYADFFHRQGGTFTLLRHNKKLPIYDFAPDRSRNFFQWNALSECHMAYTSTHWQKSLYPSMLSSHIEVLHEGIDTAFFTPKSDERFSIDACDLSHVEELVTFSGRSFDSKQNFMQFLRSLPYFLQKRPKCHALIMSSAQNKTTTNHNRLERLHSIHGIDTQRVHFIDFNPYKDYKKLLQASSLHVFLSKPFALSSGLFEAMSCGCLVLGPDTPPVREIIHDGCNGFLYNSLDEQGLGVHINSLLERREHMAHIRKAARDTVVKKYNVQTQAEKTATLILNNYAQWKSTL